MQTRKAAIKSRKQVNAWLSVDDYGERRTCLLRFVRISERLPGEVYSRECGRCRSQTREDRTVAVIDFMTQGIRLGDVRSAPDDPPFLMA